MSWMRRDCRIQLQDFACAYGRCIRPEGPGKHSPGFTLGYALNSVFALMNGLQE
jgi:hypothetical protein